MLFNRNLPIRGHKTSLRAFISWIAGMTLRMQCAYLIGAPILKPEMQADTQGKALLLFDSICNAFLP